MDKSLRNFILKAALFVFLFFLPVITLEIMLRQPQYDSYALKKYLIENTLSTNEVLIIGNSLSWGGLNPGLINENCINIANYNQSFYSDYKILEKYLPKSQKLTTVILPITVESFFSVPDERSEQTYSALWGIEPHHHEKSIEYYSTVMIYGFWSGIKQLFKPKEAIEKKGWGVSDHIYKENMEAVNEKFRDYQNLMAPDNFEFCTNYLSSIADICKAHDLRLILYISPFSNAFNQKLEADVRYKKMMEYVEEFCDDYSLECYDFGDNEIFTDEYFRDVNHLNLKGSERLSKMMHKILDQPPSAGLVRRASYRLNEEVF